MRVRDLVVPLELLSLVVVAYPFVRGWRMGRIDVFEPIYWFVGYTAFTIFARGYLDLQIGSAYLGPLIDVGSDHFRRLMQWVFFYSSLFLVIAYVAYYSPLSGVAACALPRLPSFRLSPVGIGLAGVGALVVAGLAAWLIIRRIGAYVATGDFTDATREGGIFWM